MPKIDRITSTTTNIKVEMGGYHDGLCDWISLYDEENNSIWVIVDQLNKSSHFIPIRNTQTMDQMAVIYLREIMQLHVALSITSDRDLRLCWDFGNLYNGQW